MKTQLLAADGAQLRFHDLPGPPVPLIFLHGLGCASSCDFPRVALDPALRPRRCLLVDLLGSGFSDRPPHFGYTVEDHARCILELLASLALTRIDLFGHSMGGSIAIVVAAMAPGRVRRLVVAEPNLDPGGGTYSRGIAWHPEAEYVARGHEATIRAAVTSGDHAWAGSMATSSAVAVHRAACSLVRGATPSWREQLEALSMPRTVIFGQRSLPDPDATRLARSGLAVEVVPDAGHSMMWENPSGLAGALQRALA